MAVTSDFTGFVPAGTPHHSGFQNPTMTYLGSAGFNGDTDDSWFDYLDDLIGLAVTAIVVYELATTTATQYPKPHTPPWELLPHPDDASASQAAMTGHRMFMGPGVVFYAV